MKIIEQLIARAETAETESAQLRAELAEINGCLDWGAINAGKSTTLAEVRRSIVLLKQTQGEKANLATLVDQLRAEVTRLKAERAKLVGYIQEAEAEAHIDISDETVELWRIVTSFFLRAKKLWEKDIDQLRAHVAELEADKEDVARLAGVIDKLWNHNEAVRSAVIKHYGLHHSDRVLAAIDAVRAKTSHDA